MMMILALLEISVLNHVPILLKIENGLNMKKASSEFCFYIFQLGELFELSLTSHLGINAIIIKLLCNKMQ